MLSPSTVMLLAKKYGVNHPSIPKAESKTWEVNFTLVKEFILKQFH